MTPFDYVRAATLAEALEAGARPGAAYLAGGTNLIDLMKGRIARPSAVVDIGHLPGLDRIDILPDGGVRIGALVRNADLAHDRAFAKAFPSIAEALLSGASAQLRNAATVGGNLLQRTRCAYFYDTADSCGRRDPGAACGALGGETRLHAVLGWTERCIATHPSDFCVPLAAFDAVVEVAHRGGAREIPITAFHLLPDTTGVPDTALAPGELVTAIRLPAASARFAARTRYLKLRDRTSYAFAVVSACAALAIDGDRIAEARLALGGVAARPWRATEAESVLRDAAPNRATFRAAADAALRDARPSGENGAKIELARRLIVRAFEAAGAGTPARVPALPGSVFAAGPGKSANDVGGSAHV